MTYVFNAPTIFVTIELLSSSFTSHHEFTLCPHFWTCGMCTVELTHTMTLPLTSSKLSKNEVSLEISNIIAYTVYTWWKSNMKRTLLFLRRKYEKQFIVANKNKIIKKRNFVLQLFAPLLKKRKKKEHDELMKFW